MLKPRTSRSGLLLAMLAALSGCASKPVLTVECPRFEMTADDLKRTPSPNWEALARRLPQAKSETPSKPAGPSAMN